MVHSRPRIENPTREIFSARHLLPGHRRYGDGSARLSSARAGPPRPRHGRPPLSAHEHAAGAGGNPPSRRLGSGSPRPAAGPGGDWQRHSPRQPGGGGGGAAAASPSSPCRRRWPASSSRHQPLVVAGTHGKTTTTAIAAWVYTACGRDPGYLIGGAPRDLPGELPRRRGRALRRRGGRVQRRLLRPRPQVPPLPPGDADPHQRRVRPRRPLPHARGAARRLCAG